MADLQPWSPESEPTKPLFLVVMALVLMGGLIGVSLILSGDDAGSPAAGAPGGRYQPAPFSPQSPVDTSSPAGTPPQMTIIEDTREFLHRLPTDRNTPKGWTNPAAGKKKP